VDWPVAVRLDPEGRVVILRDEAVAEVFGFD
jgi:hypothetical protein